MEPPYIKDRPKVDPDYAARFSDGGVLGKNPVKCLVEITKNANSFFTEGFTKYHEHSG
jgi:hypothetical protein